MLLRRRRRGYVFPNLKLSFLRKHSVGRRCRSRTLDKQARIDELWRLLRVESSFAGTRDLLRSSVSGFSLHLVERARRKSPGVSRWGFCTGLTKSVWLLTTRETMSTWVGCEGRRRCNGEERKSSSLMGGNYTTIWRKRAPFTVARLVLQASDLAAASLSGQHHGLGLKICKSNQSRKFQHLVILGNFWRFFAFQRCFADIKLGSTASWRLWKAACISKLQDYKMRKLCVVLKMSIIKIPSLFSPCFSSFLPEAGNYLISPAWTWTTSQFPTWLRCFAALRFSHFDLRDWHMRLSSLLSSREPKQHSYHRARKPCHRHHALEPRFCVPSSSCSTSQLRSSRMEEVIRPCQWGRWSGGVLRAVWERPHSGKLSEAQFVKQYFPPQIPEANSHGSYKNFKYTTHNKFFELNLYEKDPANLHHWRANIARHAGDIDLPTASATSLGTVNTVRVVPAQEGPVAPTEGPLKEKRIISRSRIRLQKLPRRIPRQLLQLYRYAPQ